MQLQLVRANRLPVVGGGNMGNSDRPFVTRMELATLAGCLFGAFIAYVVVRPLLSLGYWMDIVVSSLIIAGSCILAQRLLTWSSGGGPPNAPPSA